jgi:hypothetical protein
MRHHLEFEIDHQHERGGWIHCWLTTGGERHHLHASATFPPFLPLLRFVKAVAGQRFPARMAWDEEGVVADFTATAIAEESPFVHLRIRYDVYDENLLWFEERIERDEVVAALLPPLLDFFYNFAQGGKYWEFSEPVVRRLCQAIVNGIPPRSDVHAPQTVVCAVYGGYDMDYLDGRVFFTIAFEEETLVSFLRFDTHSLWPRLLEFFGAIAGNALPACCEELQVVDWGFWDDEVPELVVRRKTRLCAEPLAAPENFRLRIWESLDEESAFLLLDEVVERRQFVDSFATSLRLFLATEYCVVPDPEGGTFDLRTLTLKPLDMDSET